MNSGTKDIHQIRVTGILINNDQILLVQQKITEHRNWSLPGGRVETGETLEQAMIREMREETGLHVSARRLLYVSDKPEDNLLHIIFDLEYEQGELRLPTNEFETNPISDVRFVDIADLTTYGFSDRWCELVTESFPNTPSYVGHKRNIGL